MKEDQAQIPVVHHAKRLANLTQAIWAINFNSLRSVIKIVGKPATDLTDVWPTLVWWPKGKMATLSLNLQYPSETAKWPDEKQCEMQDTNQTFPPSSSSDYILRETQIKMFLDSDKPLRTQ